MRSGVGWAAAALVGGLVATGLALWSRPAPVASGQEAVVFVVLDTVRAQNLSLCGYDRPTSPTLEHLVREGGAASCRAYAPSSWTLPSHASFFTGVHLHEHGAGAGLGALDFEWGDATHGRPLGPELPTLAERFRERGYQTVLLSANPVVSEWTGLTRGFDTVRVAPNWRALRGEAFGPELLRLLQEQVSGDRPLFLFVNLVDAHSDWQRIPDDVDWVPARRRLKTLDARDRYEQGRLSAGAERALRSHLRDLYDYGVWSADRNLGVLLDTLEDRGWRSGPHRIVITSDHGEFLGEHHRILHGGTGLWEEVTRVPLVVWDSRGTPELPELVSALAAHDLVLDGRSHRPAGTARAARFTQGDPDRADGPCPTTAAVVWTSDHKQRCRTGDLARFDLSSDPAEEDPLPVSPDDEILETWWRELEDANQRFGSGDADITDALEALGYHE